MDRVTPEVRSKIMSAVHSKNTGPEIQVRRITHAMGFRYRLHRKDLPGTPDLVFAGKHKVIFVHGCFWHGHPNCSKARLPKTRTDYWKKKIKSNRIRDAAAVSKLKADGWSCCIIWQCELKEPLRVAEKIKSFLMC
jgi:DNA mismatch endonuclease (patch repair protein)